MLNFIVISSVDSNLARVSKASLSQQTLMELLVQDFSEIAQYQFQGRGAEFHPTCEWRGVQCNDDDEVFEISWDESFPDQKVPMDFAFIPPTVTTFMVCYNDLECAANFSELPGHLEYFRINSDNLTGSVTFETFPQSVQSFFASDNRLSGSIQLQNLPCAIEQVELKKNSLTGTLDLTGLPKTLVTLDLGQNCF